MFKTKYLIIGNGIAGISAVKEIRKNDNKGTITIVSKESFLTYYRPKLIDGIYKDLEIDDILVNKNDWYVENNINILLKKIVEKIDIVNSKILLDDGQEVEYEKLLIATGSKPFIPPITGRYKKGVFALRTYGDLQDIKNYIKNKKSITVIGGGLLGLEAAYAFKQLNKEVNIIEFAPYLLPKQLDKELGDKLQEQLQAQGINIYLPEKAEEILGDDYVTGIRIGKGNIINTESILISSGIRPNLDLVRNTEIAYNKGIIVNELLESNITNIFAAGDVIEVNDNIIGLWTSSNEQGRIAGHNMSGDFDKYEIPKLFASLNIGNIKIFSAGNILDYDNILEYREEDKDIHHKLFIKGDFVNGAILFGELKGITPLKKAIFNKLKVEEYLKDGIPFN